MVRATFPSLQVNDKTELARGMPDRDAWLGGIGAGLKHLAGLTQGHFVLTDTKLMVNGRARDTASYRAVLEEFGQGGNLPSGVTVGSVNVLPPHIKPYVWTAMWSDGQLTFTGYVPDERTRETLIAKAKSAFPDAAVADRMEIGDGSPRKWQEAVVSGLGQLARLNEGDLEFVEWSASLSGTAQREETAKSVRSTFPDVLPERYSSKHGIDFIDREIPTIEPYVFGAALSDGRLVLTGYAPSDEARVSTLKLAAQQFAGIEVVDQLALGKGAPEDWHELVEEGFEYLSRMLSGKFAIEGSNVTLTGEMQKETDAIQLREEFASGAAQNYHASHDVAFRQAAIPTVSPFTLDIQYEGSTLAFAGYMPGESARERILAGVRNAQQSDLEISDDTKIANGAPDGWEQIVAQALGELLRLNQGRLSISDTTLSLSGTAQREEDAEVIERAFLAIGSEGNDARADLEFVEASIPLISPFEFTARLSESRIELTGYVPDEAAKAEINSLITNGAGDRAIDDRTDIGRGAPDGWLAAVRLGLLDLLRLNTGALVLSDRTIRLDGVAQREATVRALRDGADAELPQGFEREVQLDVVEPAIPLAEPYIWQAKRSGSEIELTGHVTGEDARAEIISIIEAADPRLAVRDRTEIARGAPDGWLESVTIALTQLMRLNSGTLVVRDREANLKGEAQREAEAEDVQDQFGKALPEDFSTTASVSFIEPTIPTVSPYTWSLVVDAEGVTMSGHVPGGDAQGEIVAAARAAWPDQTFRDQTRIASGAPAAFEQSVVKAVELLAGLSRATLEFEDTTVTLTGTAQTEEVATTVNTQLSGALGDGYDVAGVVDFLEPTDPVVSPFVWRATLDDEALVLSGHVPGDKVRRKVLQAARELVPGRNIFDQMSVARGAPEGVDWMSGVRFALEGLEAMTSGEAVLVDGRLDITGQSRDPAADEKLRADIAGGAPEGFAFGDLAVTAPSVSPYWFVLSRAQGGLLQVVMFPRMQCAAKCNPFLERRFPIFRSTIP